MSERPCRRSRSWLSSERIVWPMPACSCSRSAVSNTRLGARPDSAHRSMRTTPRSPAGARREVECAQPDARARTREEATGRDACARRRPLPPPPPCSGPSGSGRRAAGSPARACQRRRTCRSGQSARTMVPRSSTSSVRTVRGPDCGSVAFRRAISAGSSSGAAAASGTAEVAGEAGCGAPSRCVSTVEEVAQSSPSVVARLYEPAVAPAPSAESPRKREAGRRGARYCQSRQSPMQRLARLAAVYPQTGIASDPCRYCKLARAGGDGRFRAAVVSDPKPGGSQQSPSTIRWFNWRLTVNGISPVQSWHSVPP